MTTDLSIRETVQLDKEQVKFIADTEFVPKAYRGNVPAIFACIATGRELGLGDLHALRSIHIVDGKPTLSAELMVSLARRAGHSISGETGPESATVRGKRGDNGDEMAVTWTMEMAKRAGLATKTSWKSYPEALLWARAVSQLCRMLFSDVLAGVSHTPDEFELSDEARIEQSVSDLPLVVDVEDSALEPDESAARAGAMASGKPSPETEDQTTFAIPEAARKHEDNG